MHKTRYLSPSFDHNNALNNNYSTLKIMHLGCFSNKRKINYDNYAFWTLYHLILLNACAHYFKIRINT